MLGKGLIAAFGWLRRNGAQVVNVSATARPSRALIESLRALQLSGTLVVAAVGNGGRIAPREAFPASQPGVLGVGALAPRSSTQVWVKSTRGSQVDLVAPAEGIKVVTSSGVSVSRRDGLYAVRHLVRGAARDGRRRDGVGDSPRLVGDGGRERARAQRDAARRRRAQPRLGRGASRRATSAARRTAPGSARAQRLGRRRAQSAATASGTVVVASLGYAGDRVDAYTVDVPAGTTARAVLRTGAAGLTMRRLPVRATDTMLDAVPGAKPTAQVGLPAGRSLLVVARRQGAGPYTLALSGS